jgi:hypothetical protein
MVRSNRRPRPKTGNSIVYAHGSDTSKVCGSPHIGDVHPGNIGRILAKTENIIQINALRSNIISRIC